ncbi:hypothetical protein D9M69_571390 [compost metagenome]
MLLGDLVHDGQTQARAVNVGAQRAVERLQHECALVFRDARPVVLDLQNHHAAEAVQQHTRSDDAIPAGIVDGVVHQVARHLLQQGRIAFHQAIRGHLFGPFVTQVDPVLQRPWNGVLHDPLHEPGEVDARGRQRAAGGFGAGE